MIFNIEIIKSKIGKDVIITFTSQVFIMLFLFLINKILSNELGVDGYGQYSIIKKTSGVIALTMISGMGIALPRYISYYKAKGELAKVNYIIVSAILIVIITNFVIFLLLFFFRANVESLVIGSKNNSPLFYSTILYSSSICISTLLYSYYRGIGNFLLFNLSQIIVQVLILISCFFSHGRLLLLLNIWSITTFIYTLIAFSKELKAIFKNVFFEKKLILLKSSVNELYSYGYSRLIGDFILFSFSAAPLLILNSKYGIKETAFFSVGIMITNMIIPFFSFLGMILLPYVSERFAMKRHKEIKKAVNNLLFVYLLISILICVLVFFNVDFIIKLLFNKLYLKSAETIKIIIWLILPQAIYMLLRNPLDAVSKFPYNALNLAISFAIMLIMLYHSTSKTEFNYSYLISNIILAVLSLISWYFFYKSKTKVEPEAH